MSPWCGDPSNLRDVPASSLTKSYEGHRNCLFDSALTRSLIYLRSLLPLPFFIHPILLLPQSAPLRTASRTSTIVFRASSVHSPHLKTLPTLLLYLRIHSLPSTTSSAMSSPMFVSIPDTKTPASAGPSDPVPVATLAVIATTILGSLAYVHTTSCCLSFANSAADISGAANTRRASRPGGRKISRSSQSSTTASTLSRRRRPSPENHQCHRLWPRRPPNTTQPVDDQRLMTPNLTRLLDDPRPVNPPPVQPRCHPVVTPAMIKAPPMLYHRLRHQRRVLRAHAGHPRFPNPQTLRKHLPVLPLSPPPPLLSPTTRLLLLVRKHSSDQIGRQHRKI